MEPIIDQLAQYKLEISSIAKSLQKEENAIKKNGKSKYSSQRLALEEQMTEIMKIEYELANEFLKVLEEHDFLKTDSPELERAWIKKDYLDYKQCRYNAQLKFVTHKETFLDNSIKDLPKEKNLMYEKISQKLHTANNNDASLYNDDTYNNLHCNYNNNDGMNESVLSTQDKELIEAIAFTYNRKIKNVNEITSQRSVFTPRPTSIPRKKRIRFLSSDDMKENNVGYDKRLPISSSVKTIDGVVNPNKSFYLLWNLRLKQSVSNLFEIGHDELGGNKICRHLLKTYHNNIVYTEKMRSSSGSTLKKKRKNSISSEKSNRRHIRESSFNNYDIPKKVIEHEQMEHQAQLSIKRLSTEN